MNQSSQHDGVVFCSLCNTSYNWQSQHICPNGLQEFTQRKAPPIPLTPKEKLEQLRAKVDNDHKTLRLLILDVADIILEAIGKSRIP